MRNCGYGEVTLLRIHRAIYLRWERKIRTSVRSSAYSRTDDDGKDERNESESPDERQLGSPVVRSFVANVSSSCATFPVGAASHDIHHHHHHHHDDQQEHRDEHDGNVRTGLYTDIVVDTNDVDFHKHPSPTAMAGVTT